MESWKRLKTYLYIRLTNRGRVLILFGFYARQHAVLTSLSYRRDAGLSVCQTLESYQNGAS